MGNWAPPQKTGDCLRFPSQSSARTLDLRPRSNSHPLARRRRGSRSARSLPFLAIAPIRASASVGKSGSPASKLAKAPFSGPTFASGPPVLSSRSHKGKGAPPQKTGDCLRLPSQSSPRTLDLRPRSVPRPFRLAAHGSRFASSLPFLAGLPHKHRPSARGLPCEKMGVQLANGLGAAPRFY